MKFIAKPLYALVFILIGINAFSQSNSAADAFSKQLLGKGIIILSTNTAIATNDKALLLGYNFNSYRKYKEHLKVQLERGPLVELLSLDELLKQGIPVEPELVKHKKDELPAEPTKHEIILKLNIGMGYPAKNNSEIDY